MNRKIVLSAYFLITIIVAASCKKDSGVTTAPTTPTTPTVNVNNCPAKEYNFDIKLTDTFSVIDNYTNPWDYGTPIYYDVTILSGKGIFQPFGDLVEVYEYANTGASNYNLHFTDLAIYSLNKSVLFLRGDCSINFKELISRGGGAFNGNFTATHGSTKGCNYNVITNQLPLTITGNLDLATRINIVNIKGKVII